MLVKLSFIHKCPFVYFVKFISILFSRMKQFNFHFIFFLAKVGSSRDIFPGVHLPKCIAHWSIAIGVSKQTHIYVPCPPYKHGDFPHYNILLLPSTNNCWKSSAISTIQKVLWDIKPCFSHIGNYFHGFTCINSGFQLVQLAHDWHRGHFASNSGRLLHSWNLEMALQKDYGCSSPSAKHI